MLRDLEMTDNFFVGHAFLSWLLHMWSSSCSGMRSSLNKASAYWAGKTVKLELEEIAAAESRNNLRNI